MTTSACLASRVAATSLALLAACSPHANEAVPGAGQPTYVGSGRCATCHEAEYLNWQGSQHALAMQVADAGTVLGDFSGVSVPYFDTEAAFHERDGAFFIRVQDRDGNDAEFRITHTFGVWPLQQYLVDGPRGRRLVPQFAWDARPASAGGQRWYHLYPNEYLGPDDPLHWTGRYFTWNTMCAECHSTDLRVNYDAATDSFDTRWKEISVGCESCHGPGATHVAQAQEATFDATRGFPVDLDDRGNAAWVMNLERGTATLSHPGRQQQPESCGRCHARRAVIAAEYAFGRPLMDTHMPTLLDDNLYFADGRIQDEVYVYGSFLQSKMYAAGVTCSDCHEPHSVTLRAGQDPNSTCATCHLQGRYASAKHASERVGDCVGCHMQARTYMGVDDRRDHSFRLPATAEDRGHYGAAIAAGRNGGADAALLAAIVDEAIPAIARATLLTLLEDPFRGPQLAVIERQLSDQSPLVRLGALRALQAVPPAARGLKGSALLRDPVRAVRIEAARAFVGQADLLDYATAKALAAATDEYRESLAANLYWSESAVQLAELESRLGDLAAARRHYEHALRIEPGSGIAHHGYALFLIRNGDRSTALEHLKTAWQLEPQSERFAYVYAVALRDFGYPQQARGVVFDMQQKFGNSAAVNELLQSLR